MRLLDERTTPPLRQLIGSLLRRARRADVAVAHVRLAALDLTGEETGNLEQMRILLGRLDAGQLASLRAPGAPGDAFRRHLEALHAFISSGRVHVRSAGLGAWSPDFSIYTDLRTDVQRAVCTPRAETAARNACIIGAHYFHQPLVHNGPSLTCITGEAAAVELAAQRFEELWHDGHDVQPVVLAAIDHVLGAVA